MVTGCHDCGSKLRGAQEEVPLRFSSKSLFASKWRRTAEGVLVKAIPWEPKDFVCSACEEKRANLLRPKAK